MKYILVKSPSASSGIDPSAYCSRFVGFGSLDVDAFDRPERRRLPRDVLASGSLTANCTYTKLNVIKKQ